ncbi:hypothetical protein BJ322DRAFT_1214811 [Thelephora terrestris]|uniref:F-box domain-containing protein n=1 Tax=Thelephora terrestris TaxID=56493 RepID=A0A9P6H2M4_9AGAM|nr:hypothetical protein BJ322DRAFT_1214811 [Thelephora terrestris]
MAQGSQELTGGKAPGNLVLGVCQSQIAIRDQRAPNLTTMSDRRLPLEILDYIVDLLHDEPQALKNCCLVAKSWVPRTRKHLYNKIEITYRTDLEAWWKVFPDPGSSPGHHTRSMLFHGFGFIATGGYGMVRPFSNVVRLEMWDGKAYLSPYLTTPQFLQLICSFPLLEDMYVGIHGVGNSKHKDEPLFQPRVPLPLTGTLSLNLDKGIGDVTRELLGLPHGIHFRRFSCVWRFEQDYRWVMALVERCSDTLEYVEIDRNQHSSLALIDLSKATKLREVAFWFTSDPTWIKNSLRTILPEHRDLQKILIYGDPYYDILPNEPVGSKEVVGEEIYKQWMELDGLLVRLWESRAVRTKLTVRRKGGRVYNLATGLLPEMTKRGIIQSVTYPDGHRPPQLLWPWRNRDKK